MSSNWLINQSETTSQVRYTRPCGFLAERIGYEIKQPPIVVSSPRRRFSMPQRHLTAEIVTLLRLVRKPALYIPKLPHSLLRKTLLLSLAILLRFMNSSSILGATRVVSGALVSKAIQRCGVRTRKFNNKSIIERPEGDRKICRSRHTFSIMLRLLGGSRVTMPNPCVR